MHEKRIEIRWRDVDNYGHVNNAVYLTYLEEVRDEWLARTLRDAEAVWDYVIARVDSCRLERIGTASVRTREQIHTAAGALAADASAVLVARNRDGGSSQPIAPREREAFERELEPAAEARD